MAKVIAFVPARVGSKSIPFKNIKSFCGKPLIYWNLVALQRVEMVQDIIVATDSDLIRKVVEEFHFSKVHIYMRDPMNAQDTSSTESVMLEYIQNNNIIDDAVFILVQATSPLTQTKDFIGALNVFSQSGCDSLLSCVRTKRFFWTEEGKSLNYDFLHRPRRQDFKGLMMENGAFYISTIGMIKRNECRLGGNIAIYEMDEFTSIEIDEPDEWCLAERLMRKHILKENIFRPDIKLFLTDIDGVLTDAGMYYSETGDELKKFNTRDGKAIELLRNNGIKTGIITSEKTKIVERRAQKLKIDYLVQAAVDKLTEANNICRQEGIDLKNVAYIGDDINDKELLENVGWAACPQDAEDEIKSVDGISILNQRGGDGVVREFVNRILKLHEVSSEK